MRSIGGALENNLGHPVHKRTIDFIGVRGHPREIGGTPVHSRFNLRRVVHGRQLIGAQHPVFIHIVRQQIVQQRVGVCGLHQIPRHRVHQALGFARGARGVDDKQRVFGIVQLVLMGIGLIVHQVVVPNIAPGRPRNLRVRHGVCGACTVHHDHVLDIVLTRACFIGVHLHGHDLAAAVLPVGGDQNLRAGVFHPEFQRLRREPAEHERMNCADPRARKREDNGFGNNRQVDYYTVAFTHAEFEQAVGGAGDASLQFGVGDSFTIAGFPFEIEGYFVAAACLHVAVHAVVGDVEFAALEPLNLGYGVFFDALSIGSDNLRFVEGVCVVPSLAPA